MLGILRFMLGGDRQTTGRRPADGKGLPSEEGAARRKKKNRHGYAVPIQLLLAKKQSGKARPYVRACGRNDFRGSGLARDYYGWSELAPARWATIFLAFW
jgi:hypothetical protein